MLSCDCNEGTLSRYCAWYSLNGILEEVFLSVPEFHICNSFKEDVAVISKWTNGWEARDRNTTKMITLDAIDWNLDDIPSLILLIKTYVTFS